MPLIFPTSPTLGQTYSSGSSAVYQWNGSYWGLRSLPSTISLNASDVDYAVTSSYPIPVSGKVINKQNYSITSADIVKDFTLNSATPNANFTISYTPLSSDSYIIFGVDLDLTITKDTGANTTWNVQLDVNSTSIIQNRSYLGYNGSGGGGRAGMTINPISGWYRNTTSASKTFRCSYARSGTNTTITIWNRSFFPGTITLEEIQA